MLSYAVALRSFRTGNSDNLPIHKQRQVSAFPPNYVHSLDSSHMLLTALEMDRRGLAFTAVHDSFWTHPCDVDEMNDVLRDCFIDLYKRPLLQGKLIMMRCLVERKIAYNRKMTHEIMSSR